MILAGAIGLAPRPWHPQGMPLHFTLKGVPNVVAPLAGARIIHSLQAQG